VSGEEKGGGSIFPVQYGDYPGTDGLSFRDATALTALHAWLTRYSLLGTQQAGAESVADNAYVIADAMIERRKQ